MKIGIIVALVIILFFSILVIHHKRLASTEDKPVNMSSMIMFSGRVQNENINKLWKYDPKSGDYSEVTGLSAEVMEATESTNIWNVAYASGKWWVIAVHNDGSRDSYNNLSTPDGTIVVSDVPRSRILGTYNDRMWLYDWFGEMYSMSLSDIKIKHLESKTLSKIFRLAGISSNGVSAGPTGIPDYDADVCLAWFSLDKGETIKQFPDIPCAQAAMSPSGKRIAVSSMDIPIRIYELIKSKPILVCKYDFGRYELVNMAWSGDERYLVICISRKGFLSISPSHEWQLGILDTNNGKVVWLSATVDSKYAWGVGP